MENTLRQKACFSLGKSMVLGPKIAQDHSLLFLPSKPQKSPKTRFGRQSVIFMENERFVGSEALISCPSRQPCSRQWFLWCFGAHFRSFRTFPLFSALFAQKRFLRQKRFWAQKLLFCALSPFWGHFCTPPQTLL